VRKKLLIVGSAFALAAGPATAQAWIGGVVGDIMGQGVGKWCYDGTAKHNAKYFAGQIPYADQAMDKYLGLAKTTSSLDKMFTGTRDHRVLFIDGTQADTRTARDPWAARIAKLDRVDLVQSNDTQNIHGQWRAITSNGTTLGTYDVLLRAGVGGYHIRQMSLISTGSTTRPSELTPFCNEPGDIARWQQAKAKHDTEKFTQAKQ
jgi:hypothetical protein